MKKKLKKQVTITTVVEDDQYEALRYIALKEKIPIADLVRKSLNDLIKNKSKKYPIPINFLI